MMAYNPNSDTLRQHRERLLGIAMQHAIATGLRSLNRAKIAAEAGVSLGVVSCALGKRDEMTQLVMDTAKQQGVELKYA